MTKHCLLTVPIHISKFNTSLKYFNVFKNSIDAKYTRKPVSANSLTPNVHYQYTAQKSSVITQIKSHAFETWNKVTINKSDNIPIQKYNFSW